MAIWLHVPLAASSNSSTAHPQSSHSPSAVTTPTPDGQPQSGSSDRSPRNHQQLPHSATYSHTETTSQGPWQWWNRVRCLCSHSSKLGLILEIPSSMPSQDCLDRWVGEPVRAVMLSTKVFQSNKRGYPALPRGHQAALAMFFKLNVQVSSRLCHAQNSMHASGASTGCLFGHRCAPVQLYNGFIRNVAMQVH